MPQPGPPPRLPLYPAITIAGSIEAFAFLLSNLAEGEAWQKPHFAAARIVPKKTGSYYLIVEVEKSPDERTYWSLAYGFK